MLELYWIKWYCYEKPFDKNYRIIININISSYLYVFLRFLNAITLARNSIFYAEFNFRNNGRYLIDQDGKYIYFLWLHSSQIIDVLLFWSKIWEYVLYFGNKMWTSFCPYMYLFLPFDPSCLFRSRILEIGRRFVGTDC